MVASGTSAADGWIEVRRNRCGCAFDGVEGVDGDVFVAAGAEADDDDPWSFGGRHRQPSGTTWPVVASKVP